MYQLNYYGVPKSGTPLATFQNGQVYYENTGSVIDTNDAKGNVYRRDGCCIGHIIDDHVYLDRYYRYTQWLNILSSHGEDSKRFVDEIKTIHRNCLPYTQMWVANLYGGWVEDLVETNKTDYYGDSADPLGSGAAFLVVVEDQLVEDRRFKFYRNLEDEFYFRLKNKETTNRSDIVTYVKYFKELYGGYPGTVLMS